MDQSRILIVEDENIVALDIKLRLTELGYRIVGTVPTGEEAVKQALETEPDLILMDINLRGEMDGVEAACQIQKRNPVPIIFLTAYADEYTFQHAVTAEPFGYVLKPFNERELQTTIEVALHRHKMDQKLRAIATENKRLREEVQKYADELEEQVALRTTELAQEHGRLQTILNSVDDAIIFMDADGSILYMNPAAEQITGYSITQALGKTPRLWRGTTPPAVIKDLDQSIAAGKAWRGTLINRRQDGILYDADLHIVPSSDADGNVKGYVATHRDISHLKELQRLKAGFVSRIGHELRTPLANFNLYLDLLERGTPENYDRYISILRDESKRLSKLIVGFLDISTLDTAVDLPVLEHLNVNTLVADAVKQHEKTLAFCRLSVKYAFAPNLPLAAANKQLLLMALFHVVDNATLYAPRDSSIMITTAVSETAVNSHQKLEWVTIAIHNTGASIPPDEQGKLFDRFYRGEAAMRMQAAGAGLGLAFCKESLEKQGGFITVTSNAGEGATFTIWLPKSD